LTGKFSEEAVHQYLINKGGLEDLVDDVPDLEREVHATEPIDKPDDDYVPFELWRIIKARVLAKLLTMHRDRRKLPQIERKQILSDLLGENDIGAFWKTPGPQRASLPGAINPRQDGSVITQRL
jgi:hypothetical protein